MAAAALLAAVGCRHGAPSRIDAGGFSLEPAGAALEGDLGFALAWAPDGKTLAAAHLDGAGFRVTLCDVAPLAARRSWPVAPAEHDVRALCFSPGGDQLAAASADGAVQVFDGSGTPVWSVRVPGSPSACAWIGTRLAVLARRGAVWVLEGKQIVAQGDSGHGRANAMAALTDGTVATAGDDGSVRTWRVEGAALVQVDQAAIGGFLNSVQAVPGGWLVSRSAQPAVRTPALYAQERSGQRPEASASNAAVWWDAASARAQVMPGHRGFAVDAAWMARADAVISVGWDDRAVAAPRSGRGGAEIALPWLGQRVAASPDGEMVAVLAWSRPPRPLRSAEPALRLYRVAGR